MTGEENRSRRLGDTEPIPQKHGCGAATKVPHAVLMIFGEAGLLENGKSIKGESWTAAFEEIDCLTTSVMDGGNLLASVTASANPTLTGKRRRPNRNQLTYGNLVCLGEFLLGYRNEYSEYTDRPYWARKKAVARNSRSRRPLGKKDLGLNGTYVVIRQLEQDVRGFWQFLDKVACSNREERYKFAETLVGRKFSDGAPLVPLSNTPIPGVGSRGDATKRKSDIERNQFTYEADGWLAAVHSVRMFVGPTLAMPIFRETQRPAFAARSFSRLR